MSHFVPKFHDHFDGDELFNDCARDYFQRNQYQSEEALMFRQMELEQAQRQREEIERKINYLCSTGIPSLNMNMGNDESPRLGQRYGVNSGGHFNFNRGQQVPSYSVNRPSDMPHAFTPAVPKYAQRNSPSEMYLNSQYTQRNSPPENNYLSSQYSQRNSPPEISYMSRPPMLAKSSYGMPSQSYGLPFHDPISPPTPKMSRSPSSVAMSMPIKQLQHQVTSIPPSDMPVIKIRGQGNRTPSGHVIIYQVQFKQGARHYVPGPRCPAVLAVGEFVVTQCSRGQDLGVVTEIMSLQELSLRRNEDKKAGIELEEGEGNVSQIVRIAGMVEKQTLRTKHKDEQFALQLTTDLALNKYGLEMNVLDCEFQFDRSRLTIYYTCESRVDFRDLVKELCAIFTIRIWMKEVKNPPTCALNPKAATALATGVF